MAAKPQAPAPRSAPASGIVQPQAIRPQSFMELERFAQMASKSDFVPKSYQGKPDNIMIAIQMGSELGLAPMQAIQSIAVINARPAIFGDALIGICRASPLCEDIREMFEGEGETLTAVCMARRRGASPVMARFSVADAKRARLWGKQGPWTEYPARMLQWRARGFALRDAFPDLLRGLVTAEEANDIPKGPTIEGEPEPQPPPTPKPPRGVDPSPTPPPPAPPEPPRPAAAPAAPLPATPSADPPATNGSNGRTAEQRARAVRNWLAARQADLDAAESLVAIADVVAAHKRVIEERLTDAEHAEFSAMVAAARDRFTEIHITDEERLRG